MEIVEEKTINLDNGNTFVYAISDKGTAFTKTRYIKGEDADDCTNEKLWTVIDNLIYNRRRVRVWYGDVRTGRCWNDEYNVTGRIGRSNGNIKCPILVHNSRSTGGMSLLDSCIIRIDLIDDRRTIYCHENFHTGDFYIRDTKESDIFNHEVYNVKDDGEHVLVARFVTSWQAGKYIAFMKGERYSK